MLNSTESLNYIKGLLESPEVYYKETEGGDSADTQIDDALEKIAEEVYFMEMLKIISSAHYSSIKALDFNAYTDNQKRLFFAECYFTASRFLIAWSLKNETDMYKSTLDLKNKTVGVEKSGKLFTAEEYARTANSYVSEFEREYYSVDPESYYNRPQRTTIRIGRY